MGGQVRPEIDEDSDEDDDDVDEDDDHDEEEADDGMEAWWVGRSGLQLIRMMKRMTMTMKYIFVWMQQTDEPKRNQTNLGEVSHGSTGGKVAFQKK